MKRILQVVYTMDKGGLETYIMTVFRAIKKYNESFDFLVHQRRTFDFTQEIENLGGRIFTVIPRSRSILGNVLSVGNFFLHHREYKAIEYHDSSFSYLFPLVLARLFGIPHRIIHIHSSSVPKKRRRINSLLNKMHIYIAPFFCTNVLVCSEQIRSDLIKKNERLGALIAIVHNPIVVADYRFSITLRQLFRMRLGISPEAVVLLQVGRFSYPKNQIYSYAIWKSYWQINRDCFLIYIGDGEDKAAVSAAVAEDEARNIFFLPSTSKVSEALCGSDVLLMPSYYEGFPISLIEAQASGIYCLCSDTIAAEVAITDLVHFVSLKCSPATWAAEIDDFIHTSKFDLESRYRYGDELIKTDFDADFAIGNIVKYYN